MSEKRLLGWTKFPEPEGTSFFKKEFEDKDKLIELFKYCDQGLGLVKAEGWQFIIAEYGLEGILELDQQSKWLLEEDKGEWLRNIFYQCFSSGYDPEADEMGDYDLETKMFLYFDGTGRVVDWDKIYAFKDSL